MIGTPVRRLLSSGAVTAIYIACCAVFGIIGHFDMGDGESSLPPILELYTVFLFMPLALPAIALHFDKKLQAEQTWWTILLLTETEYPFYPLWKGPALPMHKPQRVHRHLHVGDVCDCCHVSRGDRVDRPDLSGYTAAAGDPDIGRAGSSQRLVMPPKCM
ncbi:hypothetical protein [Actinomyces ruminis]|uniref:hypothetical protein n=1 Tax=Actinomyces ruminis TaxID=1937003 RepID=UPI0011781743|nr:hypothetical protein [Actinomyces ruminis]